MQLSGYIDRPDENTVFAVPAPPGPRLDRAGDRLESPRGRLIFAGNLYLVLLKPALVDEQYASYCKENKQCLPQTRNDETHKHDMLTYIAF